METSNSVMSADLEAALADDSPLVPPVEEGEAESAEEAKPSEEAPQAVVEPKPEDFETRYRDSPEFKRFVDARANAQFQRQRDRDAKALRKAQLAEAVQSPEKAVESAKAELEQLEAEETVTTRAVARVQADLEALASDEDDGPYYGQLYRREGAEALNARLRDDPVAALRWIKKEVRRMAVEEAAKKTSPALAEAMATAKANRELAELPVPPRGVGAAVVGDDKFLELYSTGKSHDHARAAKLLGM